jgi:hypothetical protein
MYTSRGSIWILVDLICVDTIFKILTAIFKYILMLKKEIHSRPQWL